MTEQPNAVLLELDRACSDISVAMGLHRNLEVWYVVDGYEAMISHDDGYGPIVFKAHGNTIQEALLKLAAMLR